MKLFQNEAGERAQALVPENVADGQLPEEADQALRAAMERTVYAVLKSLETEEPSRKPSPMARYYDVAAVVVAAVAAGGAAILSPWAALTAVIVIGGAAPLLRKKLVPEEKSEQTVNVNEAELAEALKKAAAPLVKLLDRPEAREETEEKEVYDIHGDRSFARWLQMFALYVRRHENSNLEKLYSQLKDDLENMGIYIYDELDIDENGQIRLPDEDGFMDLRTGEEWTEVKLPIVYTEKRILMHGQIK